MPDPSDRIICTNTWPSPVNAAPAYPQRDQHIRSRRTGDTGTITDWLNVIDGNRAELAAALADSPEDDASSEQDAYLGALENLAAAVRAELAPDPARAAAMAAEAAEAARTSAPPVPGVTQHNGYVVRAVLPGWPGGGGLLSSWHVAAQAENGATAVWTAYASEDGERLAYEHGSYAHASADGSAWPEALTELARRGQVFAHLNRLNSGEASKAAYRESHALAMQQLCTTTGLARPIVRDALTEAAALGSSLLTRPRRGEWAIRYDRVRCTFSLLQRNGRLS